MSPFQPLQLPNGQTIANRIAKAAMEENLADATQSPSPALIRLYQAWAEGETGLLLSGNVMIDRRAMTGPGGVVLEDELHMAQFREWAAVGRAKGAHFWVQLNHPGRQTMANLGQQAWAPSAVSMDLGSFSKMFAEPRAMDDSDIAEVIQRFATSAALAEQAGFTGVQIHAAHGYLLSQFLSPLTNRRTDRWGGSLENRARLLLVVIGAVREAVSPQFCVSVKLNSADFQRGGFEADDARQVIAIRRRPVVPAAPLRLADRAERRVVVCAGLGGPGLDGGPVHRVHRERLRDRVERVAAPAILLAVVDLRRHDRRRARRRHADLGGEPREVQVHLVPGDAARR